MNIVKYCIKKFLKIILRVIIPVLYIFENEHKSYKLEECKKRIDSITNFKPYKYMNYHNNKIKLGIDLSIVIPVYNGAMYLNDCLDSIIYNKTKYTYEIIVVNDGSTDNSLEILKKYEKKYENIIVLSQENKGAAAARNAGIDESNGRYIAFIDGDDYIADNYIEKLLDIAIENKCDIVKCGYYIVEKGIKTKKIGRKIDVKDGLRDRIMELNGFLWMCVIKRNLLFNIRLPEGYWYEDMIVRPLILAKCSRFIGIEDCLYYYRQHSSNTTKKVEGTDDIRCLSQYYLASYIIDYAKDIGIEIDDVFNRIMLYEFSKALAIRTSKLSRNVRRDIFYLSCEKVNEMEISEVNLRCFQDRYFYKSYRKKSFCLYNLVGLFVKF